MRSLTSPRTWLGALYIALYATTKNGVVESVANIGLFDAPLPYPVKTHTLELSPSLFAASLPLVNASVSFTPTDPSQTTLGDIPFPTGAWWTNLVLEKGDVPVATMPYSFAVRNGKLHASYPFRVVLPTVIQNGFLSEMVISAVSKTPFQQQVVGFDAFGVALRFACESDPDAGHFTAHLVRGSPYVTLDYFESTPVIESMDGLKIIKVKKLDQIMTDMQGDAIGFAVYGLQVTSGHTWYAFASDPTLTLALSKQGQVVGDAPFTGVIRIALAISADALPYLIESAPVYPLGGQVKYKVDIAKDTALLEFQWKTKRFPGYSNATSQLLMLALPHHNDTFVPGSVEILDDLRYTAIRGLMVGTLGETWQMEEELPAIEWNYAEKQGVFASTSASAPKEQKERTQMAKDATDLILKSLKQDIQAYPTLATDSYNFGKLIARDARLLLIADAFQEQAVVDHQVAKLKRELGPWLSASNSDVLVYDKRFGGLLTSDGIRDYAADYGNGWYNDHHFHYGYFLNALAVLRKHDPAFIETHASAVAMLVADIGAPLDSTTTSFLGNFPARHYFPTARHKDWFVGHSYASGLFIMQVGKSQESSSECINAYYGMALLSSLDDDAQTDPLSYYQYARVLLALELRGTKKYWHMRENSEVYEPIFSRNAMVGVVGEMSVTFGTWFGNKPEYVHGINMIPFTPITSQLMNEAYVAREYDQLRSSYAALDAQDIWKSIIVMDHAILDGQTAWKEMTQEVAAFDTWNSRTNALFWIATRPSWFDQRDRATLTVLNLHDEDKCFGFPACSVAGPNNSSLTCCDTLPGCCPSPMGCCPQKKLSQLPVNACFGEHKCALLGLGCCNSIDGCCTPNPLTGAVLGCCADPNPRPVPAATTPSPTRDGETAAPSSTSFCTSQPKCDALGLLCCDAAAGCCQPDPVTGGKLDCCVPEVDESAMCYAQPVCAAAKLDCCDIPGGCCTGGAALDCCDAAAPAPAQAQASAADKATCHDEPECARAGIDCCLTAQGCCTPDPITGGKLQCCREESKAPPAAPPAVSASTGDADGSAASDEQESKTSRVVAIIIGVLILMALAYCLTTCYRRRNYAPVDNDMRTWVCAGLMLVVAAFFVYLVAMA